MHLFRIVLFNVIYDRNLENIENFESCADILALFSGLSTQLQVLLCFLEQNNFCGKIWGQHQQKYKTSTCVHFVTMY